MPSDPIREVRRHFAATPEAVGDARQFLAETIGDRVGEEVTQALSLALSELATNAVRHAVSDFDVVIGIDGQVHVEVEDRSPDLPVVGPPPGMAPGGRGLRIVDQLCDRWGVHLERNRKSVWCELDLQR